MNRLMNGLDDVYDAIAEEYSHDFATRIRRFVVDLLHKEERTLSMTDPNHPFLRFAADSDREGNRLRLFHALEECCEGEDDADLRSVVERMFDAPGNDIYAKTNELVRRYLAYANTQRDSDSSDSSDSD